MGGCLLIASQANYTHTIQLKWDANIGTGKFEFYFTSNNRDPVESITYNRKLFVFGLVRQVNLLKFIYTSEKSLVTFNIIYNRNNRNNILLSGHTLEFFDDLGGECVITAESSGVYATVNFSWTV